MKQNCYLSLAMEARYWLFGSQATPLTQPLCSPRILTFLSFTVSNTMAVLSVEQDTRNVEQGDLEKQSVQCVHNVICYIVWVSRMNF